MTQTTDTLPVFTTSRVFNASLASVWAAWTDASKFGQWFGPKGFSAKVVTFDLRAGGMLHSCLVTPDGMEMWAKFVYREVQPSTKLVWEHSFSDKDGNITRHPGHSSWPLKLLSTVILEEQSNQTKLTLTWTPLEATTEEVATFQEGMAGMEQGWSGTFEQLTGFLAKS